MTNREGIKAICESDISDGKKRNLLNRILFELVFSNPKLQQDIIANHAQHQ